MKKSILIGLGLISNLNSQASIARFDQQDITNQLSIANNGVTIKAWTSIYVLHPFYVSSIKGQGAGEDNGRVETSEMFNANSYLFFFRYVEPGIIITAPGTINWIDMQFNITVINKDNSIQNFDNIDVLIYSSVQPNNYIESIGKSKKTFRIYGDGANIVSMFSAPYLPDNQFTLCRDLSQDQIIEWGFTVVAVNYSTP